MKKTKVAVAAAASAAGAALLVTGCSTQEPSDYSEIVTFTDEHGRACTGSVVVDQEQDEADDREVTSLDCEYPPEGREPGPQTYTRLPDE